jgi:hypothetical protein
MAGQLITTTGPGGTLVSIGIPPDAVANQPAPGGLNVIPGGGARVHVTGPVWVYVSFPQDAALRTWFLGAGETAPKIRIRTYYAGIMFYQSGELVPFDLAFQGKTAEIVLQLTVNDESVFELMGAAPRFGGTQLALTRGLMSWRDHGAMVLGDAGFFSLYLIYPFAASVNSLQSPPGATQPYPFVLPLVYRFPVCTLATYEETGGTGERGVALAIEARSAYYSRALYKESPLGLGPLSGGFVLFDNYLPATLTFPPALVQAG